MAKFNVSLKTSAYFTIEVEVPDDLSEDDAFDAAIEEACDQVPSDVCAVCSGWGRGYGLDLGDWELDDQEPVTPL